LIDLGIALIAADTSIWERRESADPKPDQVAAAA
jgi:hypothetical protein